MISAMIVFLVSVCGLSQLEISYGAEESKVQPTESAVEVPVLMYHHLTQAISDAKDVTITQERFLEDMKYLERNEYTSLLPEELLAIKEGRMDMPEKPIVITFDDGYESNYKLAFPVLRETGMKATIFVITKSMNQEIKGQIPKLTWVQMKEMYESGLVDIQTHSNNLHNSENKGRFMRFGISGLARTFIESQALYDLRISEDIGKSIELIETNVGNEVLAIAYPFGVFEPWSTEPLSKLGIKLGFVIGNKSADFEKLPYQATRYNVSMDKGLWRLLQQIEGIDQEAYI